MRMDHLELQRSALYELISRLKSLTPQAILISSAPADRYIETIARETDSLYVDTITDYREFMALVAHAQFAVSGRYHNPILAAIMGCPSITFGSTSHKVHGACEMLEGWSGSPYDGTDIRLQLDAIEKQARFYVENRSDLRDRLQETCRRRGSEAFEIGQLVTTSLRRDVVGQSDVTAGDDEEVTR